MYQVSDMQNANNIGGNWKEIVFALINLAV